MWIRRQCSRSKHWYFVPNPMYIFWETGLWDLSRTEVQALIRTAETLIRFPVLKPIPDWGAEVRMFLTKSSRAEASEIWPKLLAWPKDMPNSWRRQDRVLEETQSILAISIHLKHTLSLNDWTCSTEIAKAGLPTSLDWIVGLGTKEWIFQGCCIDRYSIDTQCNRQATYMSKIKGFTILTSTESSISKPRTLYVPSLQVHSILLKSESY